MKTKDIVDILVPVLSAIGGLAGAAFWFQRWVHRVDQRLDRLTDAVQQLAKSSVVSRTQMEQIQGQFKQSQIAMGDATSRLGKLSGNLDALWRVLKSNEHIFVPTRLSDRDG